MADFLSQYSIQRWLEMCPQGYLEDTVYGHGPEETEQGEEDGRGGDPTPERRT